MEDKYFRVESAVSFLVGSLVACKIQAMATKDDAEAEKYRYAAEVTEKYIEALQVIPGVDVVPVVHGWEKVRAAAVVILEKMDELSGGESFWVDEEGEYHSCDFGYAYEFIQDLLNYASGKVDGEPDG